MLKPSDRNFMMDKIGHREMLSYEEDTVDSDDEGHSDDDDEEEATDEDDDTTEEWLLGWLSTNWFCFTPKMLIVEYALIKICSIKKIVL